MKVKNKYILFLLLLLAVPIISESKEVSKDKALATASMFLYGDIPTKSGNYGITYLWSSNEVGVRTKSEDSHPTYYVFSANDDTGFVIVAGDDVISPILGYSLTNKAPEYKNIPPALVQWLNGISEYIETSRKNGIVTSESTQSEWGKTRASDGGKLLETAQWDQSTPFNKQCPMDGNRRSITGCVATAVSTIMFYHKWPDAGNGYTQAYVTDRKQIQVAARNLENSYEWDKMLLKYKSGSYSEDQANAVARLLADVGAAYEADYTYNSTGAISGTGPMYKYFKYDSGMSCIARKDYFADEYDKLLIREINALRPVLNSGTSKNGGHAFIIDGYDASGNFHINWGWGGISNGYFPITSHDYNQEQESYINIKPKTTEKNTPEYWITLYNSGIVSTIEDTEDYKPNEYFMLRLLLNNRTSIDFNGYIRAAVVNAEGELKEWIMNKRSFDLNGRLTADGKSYTSLILNCKLGAKPEVGDKIRIFYSLDGSNWELIITDPIDWDSDTVWELPISVQNSIRESTSVKYNNTEKSFSFKFDKGVTPSVLVDGTTVTNGITTTSTSIDIDMTKISSGKVLLRLARGNELEEIELTIESSKQ